MKTWTMMAAMLVMALLVGVAQAEEKHDKPKGDKPAVKKVAGSITAVDATSITVQPGDAAKAPVTVAITDATKIRVDGKEAKADALKVGQKVALVTDADSKNAVAINVGEMKGHGEGRK